MNALISICIPTYRRPKMLASALASCFAQSDDAYEIVIGDDSPGDESEHLIEQLPPARRERVRYVRNVPRLGQNANVNALFKAARGERLVLLHDDDLLFPNALADLRACFDAAQDLTIAFGRQTIVAHDGSPRPAQSEALNTEYSREPSDAGVQPSILRAALVQQIPNDGFMVLTEAARRIGYRSDAEVGVYGDLDFNLRLALERDGPYAYFTAAFVSKYRLTDEAVSSSADTRRTAHPTAGLALYRFVRGLTLAPQLEDARDVLAARLADKALKGLALQGARGEALRLFFSRDYPPRARISRKGLYHLALIALPGFDRLRRYAGSRSASPTPGVADHRSTPVASNSES